MFLVSRLLRWRGTLGANATMPTNGKVLRRGEDCTPCACTRLVDVYGCVELVLWSLLCCSRGQMSLYFLPELRSYKAERLNRIFGNWGQIVHPAVEGIEFICSRENDDWVDTREKRCRRHHADICCAYMTTIKAGRIRPPFTTANFAALLLYCTVQYSTVSGIVLSPCQGNHLCLCW